MVVIQTYYMNQKNDGIFNEYQSQFIPMYFNTEYRKKDTNKYDYLLMNANI